MIRSFLDTPFVRPTGGRLAKIWFWFVWPLKLILFVTVPDSRYKRWRNWYPVTFVMCVIWIAISSYLVSWMMTVLGDTLGIADSIMGITFLAAGGNMPELVSIVILTRRGKGRSCNSRVRAEEVRQTCTNASNRSASSIARVE